MSHVFLFPGQGSELPGMGGAALTRPGPVRSLLDRASQTLGIDLAELVARGGHELTRTEFSQPALTAVGLGLALEARAKGLEPYAVAGHSVGELSAFALAGCLEPDEAIDCVLERARLMSQAARANPGGMAAVRELGAFDELELAAHNGPSEWVVTGARAELSAFVASRDATALPVSGPWHSRFMAGARTLWRERLGRVAWKRPQLPLVVNAKGGLVADVDDLAELLASQLTSPVRWAESMQTLDALGGSKWHVFGPGRVLRGLCRANLGNKVQVEIHDGGGFEVPEAHA